MVEGSMLSFVIGLNNMTLIFLLKKTINTYTRDSNRMLAWLAIYKYFFT